MAEQALESAVLSTQSDQRSHGRAVFVLRDYAHGQWPMAASVIVCAFLCKEERESHNDESKRRPERK